MAGSTCSMIDMHVMLAICALSLAALATLPMKHTQSNDHALADFTAGFVHCWSLLDVVDHASIGFAFVSFREACETLY
eukprot:1691367-Amphidinium_carterae.1